MSELKPPKKIALISDMTGFGRCSMTVALPVISVLGVQACPVPTGIFSNHTAFPTWYKYDFTSKLPEYLNGFEALSLQFDGIYSSYLSNVAQADIVREFILKQKERSARTTVIIDPVMGDHGKTYQAITPQLCDAMKELVSLADIITPNLTEACLLTGHEYLTYAEEIPGHEYPACTEEISAHQYTGEIPDKRYHTLLKELSSMGPKKVVITGIKRGTFLCNDIYDHGSLSTYASPIRGESRPGTGDIFASILSACAVKGVSFRDSVKHAADFIGKCTNASHEAGIPVKEGVCFEYFLSDLIL